MKAPSPWRQWTVMMRQGLRAELSDKERLISPILFSVTMLLLFAFALGEVEEAFLRKFYVAQTFLTAFFSLQLSFSRLFEPDRQDRVFDLMRSYPVSSMAWFLAKYTLILGLGFLTLFPTMIFSAFLHDHGKTPLFSFAVLGIAVLALAGLAAIGILLSAMTLKANSRQILYPLLYFPMTTPVLLAATNASLSYLETWEWTGSVKTWLSLLCAFDAIYLTLGILLFGELIDDT